MAYTLPQFLDDLFDFCDAQAIDYCFSRNYRDLPDDKQSGDLDLLITPGRAPDIIDWIDENEHLTLVNKIIHIEVDNLFIAGVHWGDGFQAIQLDLFSSLNWKGIPFLPIENALLRAKPLSQEKRRIHRPDPIDEMVMAFVSTTLNAGIVKDKYWDKWVKICAKKPQAVRDKFKRRLGDFYSNALIDHIERGDKDGVINNKHRWRFGFLQHNWHQEGLHVPLWILKHIGSQLKNIFRLKKTSRIVFFGVDGAGKTTVLNGLSKTLNHFSKDTSIYHVRPILRGMTKDDPNAVLQNPQGKPLRSPFTSTLKLFYFFMVYWIDALKIRRQPNIQIYDRYFHDMLVDPRRYRFGGSQKLLSFMVRLIPKPDLVILVDIAPEIAQQRKQEVLMAETTRQCAAYRQMVPKYFKQHLVISGQGDIDTAVSQIHQRVVDVLGQKNRAK